jgi:hypothetical protein
MPVVLATQEAEIRRVMVSKPARASSLQDPISIKKPQKPSRERVGGVGQGVGPEFKLQYHKMNR